MSVHYFQKMTQHLQQQGTGLPQLIVDVERFQQNLNFVAAQLPAQLQPRLVVKSLACLNLLQQASQHLNTQRFMLFHLPQIDYIAQQFPQADVLLGKPMPLRAVEHFYQQVQSSHLNIQWLIDQPERLQQYLNLAQRFQLCLKINIEIDIGLHRGGVQDHATFVQMLELIQQHPEHLKFSGLMGYDAHVTKLPNVFQLQAKAYQDSQQQYRHYKQLIQDHFPELWHDNLCFNGGGSLTFMQHCQHSECNDLAFGSMLLKPSDFDLKILSDLQSALWIATPVLKVLAAVLVPGLDRLQSYLPQSNQAVFVYGGYWMADYVYPESSHPHALYGRSSNQELIQVPKQHRIQIDDYVFLRPQQSEAVLPQFEAVYAYQHGQFTPWATFRE
ncbi:alanine racemase [Acinetobacter sp. SwsAc5]|uniref:alanine racemase n=1 Tax=Acinetobacter sp. SwsAc5 TaxID=2749438 RepID=UPI0015BF7E4D|nr:alanine racemase [Acinetobacter sp. SwsAc5]NWK53716.1 alanine racemase [Acinetobacter sp. SwsAc5]